MVKEPNLFTDFHSVSGDFLKVLGEMSSKADQGRPVITQIKDYREQVATIELFWDVTEKIFLKYEERLLQLRMLCATEHAQAIILRNELRDTYNEMFKVRDKIPETVLKVMTKTALPSKADFDEEVVLKNRPVNNGEKS
jgi:hypothetical protein